MDHVSDGYVEVCDVNVTANEINCLSFPIQNDIQSGIKGGGGRRVSSLSTSGGNPHSLMKLCVCHRQEGPRMQSQLTKN